MNKIAKLISLFIVSVLAVGFQNYYHTFPTAGANERTLPPDLIHILKNRSYQELIYEDCLNSYSLCMTFERQRNNTEICSVEFAVKRTFKSFCEMVYENCKGLNRTWRYFHDGPCSVEFVEEFTISSVETTPSYPLIFDGYTQPPSDHEGSQPPDGTGGLQPKSFKQPPLYFQRG